MFAQTYEYQSDVSAGASIGFTLVFLLLWLLAVIPGIIGMWKTFVKAGQPGWSSLIPIYNYIQMARITGRPDTWALLMLIPCVNIYFAFKLQMDLAKSFGKDAGYGIGLVLLPMVFWPILGFGDSTYLGPVANENPNSPGYQPGAGMGYNPYPQAGYQPGAVGAPPASTTPAGWYPNPEGGGQRYWDGNAWTEHQAP
jgi:hypothetical protein